MMSYNTNLFSSFTSFPRLSLVVKSIFEIIQEINRAGVNVLLIEQNAKAALEISDYAYVLETGVVTLSGTGKELLGNDKVRAAYLGE